ncbi:MAG TPA: heme o synthase [Ktedonobacterales bacterium]|jgi:protoheme IX farnesyltransferase|nr:heme o synthase [Ktedonobacterales bacterium]
MQHVSSATTARAATERAAATWRVVLSSYIGLMKPHVTVLLLGTTLAAMALAGQGLPPVGVTIGTLLGGLFAAGSANAINCYWDRDIDRLMSRTKARALPAGRISDTHALLFGITLGALSFFILGFSANWLAAALAVSAILFYVCVYTMWLKRTTTQNIVIGGAAGAVPVLVGWAAATGSLAWPAFWMFVIVFMWTPPHFWALSLVLKKDYARAGVPMLPVVKGEAETYRQIVLYTVLLAASSLPLFFIGALGYIYLAVAVLLGGGLIVLTLRLMRIRTLKEARAVFWFSNYYLALLFAAMVIDHIFH